MQRRSFLNASIWSVLGCTILPGKLVARPYATAKGGTSYLLDRLGFRKQHIFSIEESLFQCGEDHLVPWLKTGYTPLESGMFWQAEANYAILPVQKLHPQWGLLDCGTLHFAKSSGKWAYCGSLSGFHIEAIHKALKEVDLQNMNSSYCRELLLPIATSEDSVLQKDMYLTSLGSFELKAKIGYHRPLIKARLIQSGTTLWEKEYLSDHMRANETEKIIS